MTQKRLAILGATGSIGCSTLDLVRQHPDRFKVIALSANTQGNKLFEQCLEFRPEVVVMGDDKEAKTLQDRLNQKNINVEVLTGASELLTLVQLPHVDIVVSAIMGAAGLRSTLAAARAGKTILLANKESLVMTGNLLLQEAKKHGAILLPVDSEHNAIFQCMPPNYTCGVRPVGVRRILLTASGGPFFKLSSHDLDKVTPEEAINHPNWRMGKKISVDCATLMNKGLELIEACLLFSMTPDEIEIVIHPQSVIHSLVDYVDGSVLAQCGTPDMRIPIANMLAWPDRIGSGAKPLDLISLHQLEFYAPCHNKFPCLQLATDALRFGNAATAVLNASNEVAVAEFLAGRIKFTDIAWINQKVLGELHHLAADPLEAIFEADNQARALALRIIKMN